MNRVQNAFELAHAPKGTGEPAPQLHPVVKPDPPRPASATYLDGNGRKRSLTCGRHYDGFHIESRESAQASTDRRRAMSMASV